MSDLTQLGVGATVALLILDKVFGFLKNKRKNGSGELSPDYWKMEIRKAVREELESLNKTLDKIWDRLNRGRDL